MVHIPSDVTPPRLCVVEKLNGENEYGYNLHAEKGRGQFVGTVDPDSPAERGGLITGDRIFAVNGHSIIGENHKKVVERIKANPNRCEMLVISEEGAKWYNENNVQITLDLPNIERVSPMRNSCHPSNNSPPPSSWYAPTSYSQSSTCTFSPPIFDLQSDSPCTPRRSQPLFFKRNNFSMILESMKKRTTQ